MAQLCVQPTTTVTTPGIGQSSASLLSHPMNQSEQMVNQTPVVYPDAGRMVLRIEQSLVSLPMAGPPTVTPSMQVVTPSSEFQQAAPSTGLHIQRSSASLLMTTPTPVTPPMQAMIHSTPVLQNAGCTPWFDQSPAGQITAYPLVNMAMQSVSHGSALLANSPWPLNIPTIQCSSNLSAGNSLRAPAPHLRHSRSPSYVSAPNFPTLPNLLPVLHSTINSQPTSGHPAYQSGSITGIYQSEIAGGAPSIHGSISAPELPMGVNYLSGPDFQNQFFPLQSMGRNYRAI